MLGALHICTSTAGADLEILAGDSAGRRRGVGAQPPNADKV